MLQIFSRKTLRNPIARWLARANTTACENWRRDPLSHPALSAMSLTELADLPVAALRSCCRE